MVDTFVIYIPQKNFNIINPNRFNPPAIRLDITGLGFVKCVNNPTAADKKVGLYFPRLTLLKRMTKSGNIILLKVEFSAPKLLFGNNLDELEETDFPEVVTRLKMAIGLMGVWVREGAIGAAEVITLHPSKNVVMTNGYTASFAIKEFGKVNFTQKLDLNKTDFRNSGQSLQLHANSNSFVLYDKMADLVKPQGRAIDKDQTAGQQSLFDSLKKAEPRLEILRLEVRLATKVKLRQVLKAVGFTGNLDFKSLFSKSLCQKILLHYWQELIIPNVLVLTTGTDPLTTLENIFSLNPKIKIKQAIYEAGLQIICRDKGIRPLRRLVESHAVARTWYRVDEDIKRANKAASPAAYYGFIHDIEASLKKFDSYKTPLSCASLDPP